MSTGRGLTWIDPNLTELIPKQQLLYIYQEGSEKEKGSSPNQQSIGPFIIALMILPSQDKKAIVFHKEVLHLKTEKNHFTEENVFNRKRQ